jgi:L-serine dehydratase
METVDTGDPHPNTYRLTLWNAHEKRSLVAVSTGGGMIEVISVDGAALSMDGGYHETLLWFAKGALPDFKADEVVVIDAGDHWLVNLKDSKFYRPGAPSLLCVKHIGPVLPVASRSGMRVPFSSCAQMLELDGAKNTPLHQLALDYECARGGLDRGEVVEKMRRIVRILSESIRGGLSGTQYEDRVLGSQSPALKRALSEGRLLNGGALNRIILYVAAMMEVKSSMGVIVAAPTAGACAALPGAVLGMAEEMNRDEDAAIDAMLAAGLIGVFIATRWTFAAEVGGCQAEGGAASAMAAAALVTLAGGTRDQAVAAASMALQNMLGLICDPIANRVEAPCLGKNVMAASNALSCANLALAGFDPLIPLDEVIDAAKEVSARMPREHRCTSLGGLAATPTSKAIEARLAARKHTPCGSCSCG